MIHKKLDDITEKAGEVRDPGGNWVSRRMLMKSDGMGFSFHITTIFAGTETRLWYKNHVEAVYCIAGTGEVETLDDGRIYPIHQGALYALDQNDRHLLRAATDLTLACVFNPPLRGDEVHDEDGSYSLYD